MYCRFFTGFYLFFLCSIGNAELIFKVAYENEVQHPYYMGVTTDVPKEKPGAVVEMIKLLEKKISGMRVEYSRYPWSRCLTELQKGNVDATFNSSFLEKRLAYGNYPYKDGAVDPSRRLTTISYHFYRLGNSGFSWDGKQVTGLTGKVGTPHGFSIEHDLKKMGIAVESALTTQQNFANLLSGKVNVIAIQEITGDYHIKRRSGLAPVKKVYPALKTKAYYLMISHQFREKHPQLAEKVWDLVAQLREENLPKLVEKYF